MKVISIRATTVGFGIAVVCGTLASLPVAPASASALFSDDMSGYTAGTCYSEGALIGNSFQDMFNGFGSTCIVKDATGKKYLNLEPEGAPPSTHSALTTTIPSFSSGYTLTADYRTVKQLRTNKPRPWEVGWLLWNYIDNNHFYNLVLKPNGWEIDKEYVDTSGNQAQQFLASSGTPTFSVGGMDHVVVTQTLSSQGSPTFLVQVSVNGGSLRTLATVTDNGASVSGHAYTSGKVGLYTEEAEAWYGFVGVTAP
jgi:hypothetical protein